MLNAGATYSTIRKVEHLVKGKVVATGIPLGLTETPGHSGRAGAAVGQDNDYVLRDLLGMTPQEIRSCVEAGAIEIAADPDGSDG